MGIGEPFGISVNYDGDELIGVYDLSDSEEIDWFRLKISKKPDI